MEGAGASIEGNCYPLQREGEKGMIGQEQSQVAKARPRDHRASGGAKT